MNCIFSYNDDMLWLLDCSFYKCGPLSGKLFVIAAVLNMFLLWVLETFWQPREVIFSIIFCCKCCSWLPGTWKISFKAFFKNIFERGVVFVFKVCDCVGVEGGGFVQLSSSDTCIKSHMPALELLMFPLFLSWINNNCTRSLHFLL